MKPLNLSDNPDDDEETLSFLPNDPPINITVSTNSNGNKNNTKRKRHQQQHDSKSRNRERRNHPSFPSKRKSSGFCLPWMVESILFMMIIASVVVIKALHRAKVYGFDRESNMVVEEWNDLKLDDIDQWCLNKNVTDCKCSNPLTPMPRYNHHTWTHAFHQNVRAARNSKKDRSFRDLDVVFLGDSILEGFNGMKFGKEIPHKQNNKLVFQSLFDVDKGGQLDGLILAIAGDKSPNLLWRIQNGEFPVSLKTKVIWLLIGTNDFLKDDLDYCSEDVTLMGIKRVVGEIQTRVPEVLIVINGLLPRAGKGMKGRLYNDDGETTIMDAIDNVNEKLKNFCSLDDGLHYFDAKAIFVDTNMELGEENKISYFIPTSKMNDYLHPTTLGYESWGKKIIDELHSLTDGDLING